MNFTHEIKIPYREAFREKIGKNNVLQFAEPSCFGKLEFQGIEGKAYSFIDEINRRMLIFPSRVKADEPLSDYKLRIKGPVSNTDDINVNTNLIWIKHPSEGWPTIPNEIVASWRGAFNFKSEYPEKNIPGLREPQIGAIHSISSHWTLGQLPATVVMPTGTGKTETMMAVMVHCQCQKILVVVPSDALRSQLYGKFTSFGCLKQIGAVPNNIVFPAVGIMKASIQDEQEAELFTNAANVIVATASILNHCSDAARHRIAKNCSHLFVDESHHLAANTWNSIKKLFLKKPILQFTATPFRRDGKRIGGKIIYNYPLGHAQKKGYFKPVELIQVDELDDDKADKAIAIEAIRRLRSDIDAGYDHLILARVRAIKDTERIVQIYKDLSPEFNPVAIHSQTSTSEQISNHKKLHDRESRILVCVDMFGEGFDLPQLKIAAMHEIHKSLPVTLQFVGRFTRTSTDVGEAAVVINIADPKVDGELQSLYAEAADWNKLLRRRSEEKIEREISLQELIATFEGNLPNEIPIWNLRPTMSTLVYKTNKGLWKPDELAKTLPKNEISWHASSSEKMTCIAVFAKEEDVKWGRFRNIRDRNWHIVIAYLDSKSGLLYLHASDYNAISCTKVARAITDKTTQLVSGPRMFRVFHGIERPMVKNLGASKIGTIRYTMFFGPDVSAGLSQVEKAEAELNNVFGWGYQGGDRVTRGCSVRKGKVWSMTGGPIVDWQEWCNEIGGKLNNKEIDEAEITSGFLKPEELKTRPNRVPIAIEWGESITREPELRINVQIGENEYKLSDIDLKIIDPSSDGAIKFVITSEVQESEFELTIGGQGENAPPYVYNRTKGPMVKIQRGSSALTPLEEWLDRDPLVVMYADGSFSYNHFFVDAACPGKFDSQLLETIDWTGINLRKESEGPDRHEDSIQYRAISNIIDDFDVVFNDDGTGEAADVIGLRQDSNDNILLLLLHCKFSLDDKPGARVDDLYQVCGQAQKCIRWKHGGLGRLIAHMKTRQNKWQLLGKTRFIKGNMSGLRRIEKLSRRMKLSFEVRIVQPGLSKSRVSEQILFLLGTTDLFLKRTADAKMTIICSD